VRFGDYFLNSVLVTTVSVAAIVLLGAMAGYALSRFTIRPVARSSGCSGRPDDSGATRHGAAFFELRGMVCSIHAPD